MVLPAVKWLKSTAPTQMGTLSPKLGEPYTSAQRKISDFEDKTIWFHQKTDLNQSKNCPFKNVWQSAVLRILCFRKFTFIHY